MPALSPNVVTVMAFLVGLAAVGCAWARWYRCALGLWLLNRLLDGLDGLVARERGMQTDFGGYLDIMADFAVYAALPIGLYLSRPMAESAVALIVMFGSFYVNAASWMYLSAILEKRGAGARALGEVTSVAMPAGLIGATETIIFYAAFLIWPDRMAGLFTLMACLVMVGVGQRLCWAHGNLGTARNNFPQL
jgi:phosphatidylglycerophosphate synthase